MIVTANNPCPTCALELTWVDNVPGKEYLYCRACKKELKDLIENKKSEAEQCLKHLADIQSDWISFSPPTYPNFSGADTKIRLPILDYDSYYNLRTLQQPSSGGPKVQQDKSGRIRKQHGLKDDDNTPPGDTL